MDEKEIREFFQSRRDTAVRRGWRCPDELQLTAYIGRQLIGRAYDSIEGHLADCEFCRGQVAFLTQAADWTVPEEIPVMALRQARDLIPPKSENPIVWGWRWAAAGAAAVAFVLLITFIAVRVQRQKVDAPSEPLIAQQHQPQLAPSLQSSPTASRPTPLRSIEKPKSAETAPETRRENLSQGPIVVFPRAGTTVRESGLDIRWQPFPDAVFYVVRVVTTEGTLIFESSTGDTHLRISDDNQLQRGAKYLVSVHAHLRQGTTAKSKLVGFRVSEVR